MGTIFITWRRNKFLERQVKAQSAKYSEIKIIVKKWFSAISTRKTVDDIIQQRRRRNLTPDDESLEMELFNKALMFEIKSNMVEHPFDLRGSGKWCNFISLCKEENYGFFSVNRNELEASMNRSEIFKGFRENSFLSIKILKM